MKEFKIPNIDEEKSVLKTIRLKFKTLQKIENLSKKNNISVNRLINECIEFALENSPEKKLKKESLYSILYADFIFTCCNNI